MNVLLSLSLWLALIMSSCCGDVGSSETEEPPTDSYDYGTPTPDYDYTATFDYYYVTGIYAVKDKAPGIGPLSPVLLLGLAVLLIWH